MEAYSVLGIDEAGRGPGLGPMVLCAVMLDGPAAGILQEAGVRDSKAFGSGPKAQALRAALAIRVEAVAEFVGYEICEVEAIDRYVSRGGLNDLERERAAALIARAPQCKRIIADGESLFSPLVQRFPHLQASNRAEALHLSVAAASVCAKARRDTLFSEISARYAREFGPLRGGGYVNPATRAFVAEYHRRHGRLPPEARRSWPWPGISCSSSDAPVR